METKKRRYVTQLEKALVQIEAASILYSKQKKMKIEVNKYLHDTIIYLKEIINTSE